MLYKMYKTIPISLLLTVMELEQFLEILLYIYCIYIYGMRFFGKKQTLLNKVYHNYNVADIISRDRRKEIKRRICFNDNSLQPIRDKNFDRMFKIRPLVKYLQKKVQRTPEVNIFLWMS